MTNNGLMVSQNGGPTRVVNSSLVGVIEQAQGNPNIGQILVPLYGVKGTRDDDCVDVTEISEERLDVIANTPSAAGGSTRDKPDTEYCKQIFRVVQNRGVKYFIIIGGNDSADKARIINDMANKAGHELRVWHVPKTVDNDLLVNDHSFGYGSCARTVAGLAVGNSLDNMSIPGLKIDVAMGRHAGYITAASQLFMKEPGYGGPDVVFVPEGEKFTMEHFLSVITNLYAKNKRVYAVVSEGCATAVKDVLSGEADAHGNIQLSGSGAFADYLCEEAKKAIDDKDIRARADTWGYMQRSFPFSVSKVDLLEARQGGRFAVQNAIDSDSDGTVIVEASRSPVYKFDLRVGELKEVAKHTRSMPDGMVVNHVITQAFKDYALPLVGEGPKYDTLLRR